MPKYAIISIDGGGIRGLVPALILQKIESEVGKPIHEFVDLVAGTSTGGILALGLASGIKTEELVKIYSTRATQVF